MSEIEITGVFENVLGMIYSAKQKAEYQVNSTIIDLYWSILNIKYDTSYTSSVSLHTSV